ncbi:signal transduction histidine kinase [Comamonas sp. BIGb0152]|uniref:sensor histidine kinase n=1 Tax=Comamonas sp. BIGb0152 TaxID=2940601 RepID=UPI00216A0828|nr:HAMP domain-containing sensor histidine kinase [Comamonas sp. BIGb0152]MCS4292604.1 signal transduction histidine kinase [Comamonas sp. BIGb0152]
MRSILQRLVPSTLLARVALLVMLGMGVAQLLTYMAIRHEREQALMRLMISGVERDIASSVALIDRLPAGERQDWFPKLERPNYSFSLEGTVGSAAPTDPALARFAQVVADALQPFPVLAMGQLGDRPDAVRMQLRLSDGSPLYIVARRVPMPVSGWVTWLLAGQLLVLAGLAWLAVRLVTRPLARLAAAADQLGPDLQPVVVAEAGPAEVVRAARAFNAMQQRIAGYLNERMQILAAISHDLQTPITRMRLRVDLMDDMPDADKFRQDLEAMRSLVHEGVNYAKTLQGSDEKVRRLDLDALLRSIVNDYADTGSPVTLEGAAGQPIRTRPHALRRILGNLIDNALKYGQRADVHLRLQAGHCYIDVCDTGPGIPEEQLAAVLQPFYRVEASRNRDTGGSGLGLAIAHQLSLSLGGTLRLHNRPEGGLRASLQLPATS